MAIIKNYDVIQLESDSMIICNRYKAGLIFEPQNNTIWMNGEPHDHDTLGQIYKKDISSLTVLGEEVLEQSFFNNSILSKHPTVLCMHNTLEDLYTTANTNSVSDNHSRDLCLDDSQMFVNQGSLIEFTSSSSTKFYIYKQLSDYAASGHGSGWYPKNMHYLMIEGLDFQNNAFSYLDLNFNPNSAVSNSNDLKLRGDYNLLYVDTANKKMYFTDYRSGHSTSNFRAYSHNSGISYSSYTTNEDDSSLAIGVTSNLITSQSAGDVRPYSECSNIFYAGKNNDGTLMFIENIENDTGNYVNPPSYSKSNHRIYVSKVDPSTNAVTTISDILSTSFTTPSLAAKSMYRVRYSPFVNSPLSGETDVWYSYSPVSSTSDKVSFLLHNWDKSSITYTANNCTMNYPGSTLASDYIGNPTPTSSKVFFGTKSNCFVTKLGSNYYLNYIMSHGNQHNAAIHSALAQGIVTYSIGSTDWSSLTYHSRTSITSLNFAYCNADKTKLIVITPNAGEVLDFTVAGWSSSASESGNFIGMTYDNSGRVWGVDAGTASYNDVTASIHNSAVRRIPHKIKLISSSLPNSVSIEFADDSITYSGSSLSKNINVNAYDTSNVRISKSVVLKIEGSNVVFTSNNASTLTTTTSTSADTTIGLTISGPGLINIVGSFTV